MPKHLGTNYLNCQDPSQVWLRIDEPLFALGPYGHLTLFREAVATSDTQIFFMTFKLFMFIACRFSRELNEICGLSGGI